VGVVGRGRAPGIVSPVVAVVVAATCRRAAVMVKVKVIAIFRILIQFLLLDPGLTFKATFNREHNLLLSRLLLPY